jgi:hypothetical protein
MGEGPEDVAQDAWAPAHVAPVVAWLVSERARGVTGRVIVAGGDRLAIAEGWRQVAGTALPRRGSIDDVGRAIEGLLSQSAPRQVLRADPAVVQAGG